jgi:uncharacterized protein YjbJ (UPF0337 family)
MGQPGEQLRTEETNMNNPMVLVGAAIIGVALLCGGAGAQGTTDKIEGTAKELQGSVKETVGKATGDTKLERSGTADKIAGAAQNTVGDLKNAAGDINGKAANLFTWVGNYVARIF